MCACGGVGVQVAVAGGAHQVRQHAGVASCLGTGVRQSWMAVVA